MSRTAPALSFRQTPRALLTHEVDVDDLVHCESPAMPISFSTVQRRPGPASPQHLHPTQWPDAVSFPAIGVHGYDEHGNFDIARFPNSVHTAICGRLRVDEPDLSARLVGLASARDDFTIGDDGSIYVLESRSRSQHANRTRAEARLQALLDEATRG